MNTQADVTRRLRLSVNAERMLGALQTALPMLQLMSERLGPAACCDGCPESVREEYNAWLLCLLEVEGAIEAAEPQPASNVVAMPQDFEGGSTVMWYFDEAEELHDAQRDGLHMMHGLFCGVVFSAICGAVIWLAAVVLAPYF